jgi:hypothetical protein
MDDIRPDLGSACRGVEPHIPHNLEILGEQAAENSLKKQRVIL